MLKLHRKRARWLKVQPDRECKIYSCLRSTGRENPAASQSPLKALPNISSEAERWDEHADFGLLQDALVVHLFSIFLLLMFQGLVWVLVFFPLLSGKIKSWKAEEN